MDDTCSSLPYGKELASQQKTSISCPIDRYLVMIMTTDFLSFFLRRTSYLVKARDDT